MPGPAAPAAQDPTSPTGTADPGPAVHFVRPRQFWWKTALLLVTTIALVPVLLYEDLRAAQWYLVALVVVHVAGIAVIVVGAQRKQIAPDRRGLVIRLAAIAILTALLYLAAKGLDTDAKGLVFWGALFAIWALHTLGLALLHLRSRREQRVCPFV